MINNDNVLIDFNEKAKSYEWKSINDNVMGGISNSRIEISQQKTAIFSGFVSPENGGGFASVRTDINVNNEFAFKGASIRVKGDGKIYSLRFRTDDNFDGISYQSKFSTENGIWREFNLPFKEFKPTFRGMILTPFKELQSENIKQIGILISDKQYGEFQLEIDWIKLYY
jgi:NADH dehydrogenase [ubiquinone] 1 alpha subcomplex assembly factor 1